MLRPLTPAPALVPFNSINGVPANPVCDVPSMMRGSVIVGRAEVGVIVWTPLPMLKWILSVPAFRFATVIASRSDSKPSGPAGFASVPPSMSSLVVLTMYVESSVRGSSSSTIGLQRGGLLDAFRQGSALARFVGEARNRFGFLTRVLLKTVGQGLESIGARIATSHGLR